MPRTIYQYTPIIIGLVLLSSPVLAGYSIEIRVDNVFFDLINDGDPEDMDADVGDIWYHFTLNDPANRWEAEGDVFAEGGFDGQPPVSTLVTNTLIEKIVNVPIFSGDIDFIHTYAASGLQMHSAQVDGQFDNTIDHEVRGASLDYFAWVNGTSIGSYGTGLYAGPGPEPFDGSLGPENFPTTTEHHMKLRFYLDSLGDSIELFNSAEIRGFVPEPANGMVLIAWFAFGALMRRRVDSRSRRRVSE